MKKYRAFPALLSLILFAGMLSACAGKTYTVTLRYHSPALADRVLEIRSGETISELPLWEDHVFEGWYLDEQYQREFAFHAPVESDLVLHAKWRDGNPLVTFTVEHVGWSSAEPLGYGKSMVLPGCEWIKDGYRFVGWTDGASLYRAGETYTMRSYSDVTLTAVYHVTRVIRFDPNGGAGIIPAIRAAEGEVVILPTGEDFYLEGKEVIGWTDGEKLYIMGSQFTVPDADVTFWAVWGKPGEVIS